jgi:hypothetical protein
MSKTTRWSWKQGSKVIGEWRRSGLSMAAFARKRGLGTQRLRYWRDRVEGDGTGEGERRGAEAKLVPGVVVGIGSLRISVHLSRGVIVEAAAADDLEPAWLAELVVELERV